MRTGGAFEEDADRAERRLERHNLVHKQVLEYGRKPQDTAWRCGVEIVQQRD